MSKKIVIIGGVAGGATAATRARRLDEFSQITVYEKGPHPSYSNCALPNYLSREVPSSDDLLMMTPEAFKANYNIDMKVLSEVTSIDPEAKTVTVKDLATGQDYQDTYDKLILSPGASPIVPNNIQGVDQDHVLTLRTVPDVIAIDELVQSIDDPHVVVVGGGFIGLEIMENLTKAGVKVSLVELSDQVLPTLDYDMAQTLHRVIYDQGVNLILSDQVTSIQKDQVTLESGRTLPADVVILAIGVTPNIQLAQDAGIEIGQTGAIKVNANYQTNYPDIYAIGDAIEVHNQITGQKQRLALAGPAQKQARAASDHIYGRTNSNKGLVGTSVIRLFDLNAASTGLNEKACQQAGIDYRYSYVIPFDRVNIMPEAQPMFFKLIFAYPSGKILGAQAIGAGSVDKRIDVVSTVIQLGGDLEDLKNLELSYAPSFSTAKDVVNQAANVGLNILHDEFKQVPMSQVQSLVEEGSYILDIRAPEAYQAGHIKGSVNIPFGQLRSRLDELPKDQPIYVHCRSSQTSYIAIRNLQARGYDVYNIQGSILGLSNYLYHNDQVTGRESILTAYNFN